MKAITIRYGLNAEYSTDVTAICLTQLFDAASKTIRIPPGDNTRAAIFGDPFPGHLKTIRVFSETGESYKFTDRFRVLFENVGEDVVSINLPVSDAIVVQKLQHIHSTTRLVHGNFMEEYPEQMMAARFLSGKEKVLEIGGNVGRNSIVICRLLEDPKNLVVMESDADIAKQLQENRDANSLQFYIENSALSERKMIQSSWDTVESDVLLPGHHWINTIRLEDFRIKYPIAFDTLVLDCEGAFEFILRSSPEILDGIKLIIMENDYKTIESKQFVDETLLEKGFQVSYRESGGWGVCYDCFFEVWEMR